MNRSWITGLTLASVAGSGGAFAAAASSHDAPVAAQLQTGIPAGQFVQAAQGRTVNYQVGVAGTVTLSIADGVLTVTDATVGTGWTTVTTVGVGTHVEVQFTDALQLVTFGADLVGNDVVVALTNVPAPGVVPETTPAAVDVSVISQATTARGTTVAQSRPATAPAAASQPTVAPTAARPTPAATTAPSGSAPTGGDDGEHEESDEHEESNDD